MQSKNIQKIALAVIAHMFGFFVIFAFFGPGYALAATLLWSFVWMIFCAKQEITKDQLVSWPTQALFGGPLSWILCFGTCFIPISYDKNTESSLWVKSIVVMTVITDSVERFMGTLFSYCVIKVEDETHPE